MVKLHRLSSLLKTPTSVRIPRLAHLFIAKETSPSPTPSSKEDPNKYREEHGKCPRGYHIDEDTGRCITNQELMEKLRQKMEEGKGGGEEKPGQEDKKKDYEKGVPSIRKRPQEKGEDPEFESMLEQVQSTYGVMKHLPKGLRKAVKFPIKFLADRYRKGSQKWTGAVAKEEEELRKANSNNPFLSGEKMSPEEEDKAAKDMFSGAGKRWGRAIAKVGGKAFDWVANPKEAVKDLGKAVVGTLKFVGRRTGDAAEILGHIVGEHKVASRAIAKLASGRFHDITATEKHATTKVVLEGAEIFVLGHLMRGHHSGSSAHAVALENASHTAEDITEEGMSNSLVEHLGTATHESLLEGSKVAAAGEFVGEAFEEYLQKLKTGGSIKLIDEIATGIVHGEHHEDHAKHAHVVRFAKKDEEKAVARYVGKRILEDFLDKSKNYKPSPGVAFKAMKTVGDMATLTRLSKMEVQQQGQEASEGKGKGDPEISEGILQKVEKTSRATPSAKNWYDFGLMKEISSHFRKALKKIVGKLYEHTWMNSPPHHDREQLRNFGDVVVELKPGFHKDPKWKAMKAQVMTLIRSFERDYPGVTFSITKQGLGKGLIAAHSHRYLYPKEEGTLYVYRVDDLSSWW